MLKSIVLYGFPFAADVIVGLVLFVGRHSLASLGHDERTVGSIALFYGIGYVAASLAMTRIVKPRTARALMLVSLAGIIAIAVLLANVHRLAITQALYVLFPLAASLFFNAFQIFMLGVSNQDARPLAVTAGHFTFSWSLGYALGPAISALLKNSVPWSAIYYVAAAVATLMGTALIVYRPARATRSSASPGRPTPSASASTSIPGTQLPATAQPAGPSPAPARSLIGAAWLGLLVGWTVWNAVLIYWPVQAAARDLPAHLRGLVEFTAALAQGVGAFALAYLPGWHRKPGWLATFGGLGIAALLLLSAATHPIALGTAALLFGACTGSMFSALVYHGMLDEEQAVRRVALGETLVGVCFLISSPVATLLHPQGTAFSHAYLRLAAVMAVGILAQALYARRLTRT